MALSYSRSSASLASQARDVSSDGAKKELGWWSRCCRDLLCRRLAYITSGQLELKGLGGPVRFGAQPPAKSTEEDGLSAVLVVREQRFYRSAVWGGNLGVAESYLRGDWDCDDLTSLFRIFLRNRESLAGANSVFRGGLPSGTRWLHWLRDNTVAGSRRNIAAHYDLGNDFYRLWLDETMAYSSAVFPRPEMSLDEGSREKFDRICRKLELGPGDQVLEIGTGWGGFALHAAERYGCDVTTTTISQAQYELAAARIRASRAADRITLLDQDYRLLKGQFDRLVSIEMIEAVGFRHLDTYFRRCSELLKSGGSLVLQAIVMPEGRFRQYLRSVDFIQRYVFPGGCLPSVAAILESVGRATNLRLVHLEDFAPHYAETLRRWRNQFEARVDDVERLGYPERLIRTWRYYLAYCEAAFAERAIGLVQLVFDKPHCRRDPARLSGLADATLTAR